MTKNVLTELERELQTERSTRERAEMQLQDCQQRLRLLEMVCDDLIWDWNIQTGEVDRNNAAVAMFGDNSPIEDCTAEWWQNNLHPDDRGKVIDIFDHAIASSQSTVSAEYRFRRADGTYAHIYDRGSIIRNSDGVAIRAIGTMVDLTALLRTKEMLAHSEAALIHAARYSAMGTMASMIAHELNQPLAAVSNYVHASRRIAAKNGAQHLADYDEILGAAEENALRAGDIIHRLRKLVRSGHVEHRAELIESIIDDACAIALIDADSLGVGYAIDIANGLPTVSVDAIQIQQVLINLLRNAVEAFDQSYDRKIWISALLKGHFIEVCVRDNGPGIAPDAAANLFAAQTSMKASGMGIGLSICRTIVEAHGGLIWFANSVSGAEFRFTLPISDSPAGRALDTTGRN